MSQIAEVRSQSAWASALPQRPRAAATDASTLSISLAIENFPQVRRAFGESATQEAMQGLCRLIEQSCGHPGGTAAPDGDGTVVLHLPGRAWSQGGDMRWADNFCRRLPRHGFDTQSGTIHFWTSPRPAALRRSGVECAAPLPCSTPATNDSAWAARYRTDMAAAVRLLPGAPEPGPERARSSGLAWQPVCDAAAPGTILYHQSLLRVAGPDSAPESAAPLFSAMERLGVARWVDHQVVLQVLDELVAAPDVTLGVPLSVQSLRGDRWWDTIQARLEATPGLATRLVLEITETAPLTDMSPAVEFVGSMRRLGCRFALAGFGAGHASIRQLLAIAPEFAKIDGLFVRRAPLSASGEALLYHLIGAASAMGAAVIVDGVETAEQAALAQKAGGRWQQGHHWGCPSLIRPWRTSLPVTVRPGLHCREVHHADA